MAEAYTSMGAEQGGITAIHYNPAASAYLRYPEFSVMGQRGFAEARDRVDRRGEVELVRHVQVRTVVALGTQRARTEVGAVEEHASTLLRGVVAGRKRWR
jgi:hypothetical protein